MRITLYALVMVLLFASQSFSQDRLFFLNGDETDVKITEVSSSEVKYKRLDNQEGPTFSTLKSELFMIKYANGQKEMIAAATPEPTQPATTEAAVTEQQYSETATTTPSSGLSSAVVIPNEPMASSTSATDKWGRTEAENRSLYKKKIVKGGILMGTGVGVASVGAGLFAIGNNRLTSNVQTAYMATGAILVVGGAALLVAGAAVMGSSAKYKKRANMLANETASLTPSIINMHSYNGSAVQSQMAYGISFNLSF